MMARFALRLLERALQDTALVLHRRSKRLRPPGRPPIDLARRVPLWRIVEALIERAQSDPPRGLTVEAIFTAGWPGERVRATAATNRVKVALSTLRTLGLRALLLRGRDGYRIDPSVPIVVEND